MFSYSQYSRILKVSVIQNRIKNPFVIYGYSYISRLRFLISSAMLNFRNFVIKLCPHNLVKFNIIITFILFLRNRFATFALFQDTPYSVYWTDFLFAFIRKLPVFVSRVFFFSLISHLYLLSPQRTTHGDCSSHAFFRGIYDIRKSVCLLFDNIIISRKNPEKILDFLQNNFYAFLSHSIMRRGQSSRVVNSNITPYRSVIVAPALA